MLWAAYSKSVHLSFFEQDFLRIVDGFSMKFGELRTGLCLVQRIIFSQNWIFCNPFQPFQILLSFAMPGLLILHTSIQVVLQYNNCHDLQMTLEYRDIWSFWTVLDSVVKYTKLGSQWRRFLLHNDMLAWYMLWLCVCPFVCVSIRHKP